MRYLALLGFLFGCSSHFASMQGSARTQDLVLEELKIELGDIKHALHAQQVEMRLLEERLDQEGGAKTHDMQNQLALIERKMAAFEKNYDRFSSELSKLTQHANQTSQSLVQYRDQIVELDRRLDEALRLKSTLANLSKAVGQKEESSRSYRVKSGDSLEKIARNHHTSVQAIKTLNNLSSDKIVVGQELQLPND